MHPSNRFFRRQDWIFPGLKIAVLQQHTCALELAMSLRLMHLTVFLLWAAVCSSDSYEAPVRTLRVSNFTLHISAKGTEGLVEVRDQPTGALVQTLSCPLLRGIPNPSKPEIEGVNEEFVTHFQAEDLNFDGMPDLKGPREFGAKWGRYCVWLFDPKTHRFENGFLAEQMELLYNLTADSKSRRIVAYSIGPVDPMQDEYRIEDVSRERPYWPRLVPVRTCSVETGPLGKTPKATITRYDRGQIVRRKLPSNFNMTEACKDNR